MFAELKCKTNFTFLEGASSPEELVARAAGIGLPALALTDKNGVYGLPKAYWASKEVPNFKLICGADLVFPDHPPVTFLATNRKSYGVLCRIISKAHFGKEKGTAFLKFEELADFGGFGGFYDLVCLLDAKSDIEIFRDMFGKNVYLTMSRFQDGRDKERIDRALSLAQKYDIGYIATNDVLYHEKARRPLQDCFTSIKEGIPLNKAGFKLLPNAERYLKSPFEMRLLFKDLPLAISNTLAIADACDFSMSELKYRYPSEWIPQNFTAQEYLRELTYEGAKGRYPKGIPDNVVKQLEHELALIAQLSYADYFLTIHEIVSFARSKKILCQGRGGAANSAVCYCLGITAIDPVKMNLLFERFISLERNEPPDIDVDFEHERREEVIQHIYEKYGRERAAMITAVITYQKRMALRELSKAFGIDVGTLSAKKILHNFDELAKQSFDPDCKTTMDELSEEMTGFPRHLSIHSGGFTLSADPLIEIVPIEPARMKDRTVIQWDKYDLDYLGLLKVDVLSLGMLSALQKTLTMVGKDLHELPHEDKETYKMIQRADTVGTFQVESRAQMNMSGRLQPKSFYDLVVQVAIVRPGPIVGNMVHPYLKRRRGLEQPEYPHPKLKEILGRTLGVPLFQEQLMKIAIELGKFTPGEADQLRRAIGAWRSTGSITQVSEKLLRELQKENISEAYSLKIIEHMKGFAHYGFPESHAASFALLSYASCYLKRHHPAEFACGILNSQPMGFYASHSIIDDAKNHGVTVLPVNPNRSQWDSGMEGTNLRLGLHSVRGLAKDEALKLIANRPYKTLSDFLARTNLRPDILMRLAMGDAFQEFGDDQRHTLWRLLDEKVRENPRQLDLFAGHENARDPSLFESLNELEAVSADYAAYGHSARAHPMVPLRKMLKLPRLTTFEAKRVKPRTYVRTSGLLLVRQKPPTANGVCFAAIEDEHGFLDMVLFQKEFAKFEEVFLHHCFLQVGGYIERDGHSVSLIVKDIQPVFKEDEGLVIEPTQYFW